MDPYKGFHPLFASRLRSILADLQHLGWKPRIASGMRTSVQQAQKIKLGYSHTMKSWHVPDTVAFLGASKDSYYEVQGNAADIIDRRYGWSGKASSKDFQFWKDLGKTAKKHGCTWGGDWAIRDVAHVQMNFIDSRARKSAVA